MNNFSIRFSSDLKGKYTDENHLYTISINKPNLYEQIISYIDVTSKYHRSHLGYFKYLTERWYVQPKNYDIVVVFVDDKNETLAWIKASDLELITKFIEESNSLKFSFGYIAGTISPSSEFFPEERNTITHDYQMWITNEKY